MYFPVPAIAGPVAPKMGVSVRCGFVAEANFASAGTLESSIQRFYFYTMALFILKLLK